MNNIAAIRRAKGLSQTDLADLAGVEQPTISKLERGNESVTLRTLKSVAEALGVSVADLFMDRTDAERAIIEAYRNLSAERRQGWEDLARTIAASPDASPETQDRENGETHDPSLTR